MTRALKTIEARYARVREAIARAVLRVQRSPDDVQLIVVTKQFPPEYIRDAVTIGMDHFAENYVQELRAKQNLLADVPIHWHFIGRLQTNKVKDVVGHVDLIHSVDRISLGTMVNRYAQNHGTVQRCLVQVNVTGEATKAGVPPQDLGMLLSQLALLPGLRVEGLMTMPTLADNPEKNRPHFRRLAELAKTHGLTALSMGTSDDFAVAIEEGATFIRIGTALLGPRSY